MSHMSDLDLALRQLANDADIAELRLTPEQARGYRPGIMHALWLLHGREAVAHWLKARDWSPMASPAPVCETCGGARSVATSGEPFRDGEGGWRLGRRRIPCPECTPEGAALIAAELAGDER